jgi:hypothetical protein
MSRSITFRDLLEESIEVDGVMLDAKVHAIVRDLGGVYELDYFDMGDIYVCIGAHDMMKLDQDSFKSRHKLLYNRFINACELLALRKAKDTPEHKWQFESDEVGA